MRNCGILAAQSTLSRVVWRMNARQLLGTIGAALFTTGVAAILAGQNGSVAAATRPTLVVGGTIAAAIGALVWMSLLFFAKPAKAVDSTSPTIQVSGGPGGTASAGKGGVAIGGQGGSAQVANEGGESG